MAVLVGFDVEGNVGLVGQACAAGKYYVHLEGLEAISNEGNLHHDGQDCAGYTSNMHNVGQDGIKGKGDVYFVGQYCSLDVNVVRLDGLGTFPDEGRARK